MNCPCDDFKFPPVLTIHAGLDRLPRQIATFPEFRESMLAAIPREAALANWRARSSDDFGVMLLEMWAYICDCISFYDEAIAQEEYLRTALLRPSLRKLVALLGYLPRPAVGSRVELAILADGRQPIAIPAGTAFRSGAFPGGSPQVFELESAGRAHPFTNKWTLARTRSQTFEPGPYYTIKRDSFLIDPKSLAVKVDQLVLVENLDNESESRACTVASVSDFNASDGASYKQVTLSTSVPIPGYTPVSKVRLTSPTRTATINTIGDAWFPAIIFDSVVKPIWNGDRIVLQKGSDLRWFSVLAVFDTSYELPAPGTTTITDASNKTITVTPPAVRVQATAVALDVDYNDPSRRGVGMPAWSNADASSIQVHLAFRSAGTVTVPADTYLRPGQPMILIPPVEGPQDGIAPGRFLLEDKDSTGAAMDANINFGGRSLAPTHPLAQPLVAPVTVYGNVVTATRGESVNAEALGTGDASVSNLNFKLKKSPLTYFPAPDGVTSTLRVYVDGLEWSEVPSFFSIGGQESVYIVRQNDAGDSFVTFGDGVRGRRLPTGSQVVAYYRFGAGKASPPAGSVHQIAKPVTGINTVRNPVAASGGDDAEPPSGLRTYAPRSALLLGRAISIPDMEAAASSVAGVRAVRAEWRWNESRQRPLVQIWYIGGSSVADDITAKLSGLTDSVTPFEVDEALPVVSTLSLAIETDAKRLEADVLKAVRDALMDPVTGLLSPEQIGIGATLMRSRIFERALAVPGSVAVTGVHWNGKPFVAYGIKPGAGKYFDLEAGALRLNGKAGS
jgi:hypothetical protein